MPRPGRVCRHCGAPRYGRVHLERLIGSEEGAQLQVHRYEPGGLP